MAIITQTRAGYPPAHAQWLAVLTTSAVSTSLVRMSRVISLIITWQETSLDGTASPFGPYYPNVAARLTVLDETGSYWLAGVVVHPGVPAGQPDQADVAALGAGCAEASANAQRLAAAWIASAPGPIS